MRRRKATAVRFLDARRADVTLRLGIIGAGNISRTHVLAARELEGAEVVAYWGRDYTKAASMAREFGGVPFRELDGLLSHRPIDAVIIGTPSGTHADQAMLAAQRGLHVLVEKPLDVDVARIDSLLAECDRARVTLAVVFQDRTAPDLVWLKHVVDERCLGAPLLVSAQVKWYRPPEYYASSTWRGRWALDGGGALMNQGIHTVDLLLWLVGDVARVSAITRTNLHAIEVEDTAVACLEFASGAVGTLEVTTAAYPGFPRRIALTGSDGTIMIEGDRVASVDLRAPMALPPSEGSTNASASSPVVSDVRGHRRVIADFVDAVRQSRPPLCDGRDGRRSVALVDAAYRSARERRPVSV